MKMSAKIERAYKHLEEVGSEMTAKQMEGPNYKKAIKFIGDTLPSILRLKKSLVERGQ